MKTLWILFLVGMISCTTADKDIVSVNDLKNVDFTNEKNVLLDVRTQEEFAEGHISSAINIDVNSPDFDTKIEDLDTSKTYYVYCQAGVRSSKATSKLLRKGFKNIVNLKDGYKNYRTD